MSGSDAAWESWGRIDPYYGVLSEDKFRKDNLAANLDDFFRSGDDFISERLNAAHKHFGFEAHGRALDFGCGVGRLALPLAARFEKVVGVDISPAMLAEALKNADRAGIDNVDFVESDDALSRAPGRFDFVNTYIVLQHIPVKRGMAIARQLLERVAPGGVAALHFSVERGDSPARKLSYWAQRHVPGFQAGVNLLRRRKLNEPLMEMNEYSLAKVATLAAQLGFGPCLFDTEFHGRVLTAKLLCRRDGPA